MAQIKRYLGLGIVLILLLFGLPGVYAQEDAQLRLVAVDSTAFPIIRITLLTAGSHSAPADLSDLSLRENGAPITDLTFTEVPSGIDVIFVLDANVGFIEIDDDTGLTRREKTIDSILRYAKQYMNPNGLDSVSIVVPDEEGGSGRFLISEATSAKDIEEALNGYNPRRLNPTPLNAMLTLGLDQTIQRKGNDRFQAILLFTDGRRLDQQLSYPQLVAQANDAVVPIYSAILGESADPNEIENVSRLADPTRATYVHMAEPAAADAIYQIWQDQSSQVQVQYRSRQRQSGRNQLTLNLGSVLISADFDLELAAPEVEISLDSNQILRAGIAPDTPLNELQPAIQPITVNVEWPDGLPRQVTDVTLLVDGQSQRAAGDSQLDIQGQIELDWDITLLENETVELAVQVTDELGYQGISEPVLINIAIDRPLPPTPIPTVEPQEAALQVSPIPGFRWEIVVGAAFVLFLLLIAILWRRRKASAKKAREAQGREIETGIEDRGVRTPDGILLVPALEALSSSQEEPIAIKGEDVTIGSEEQSVQVVLVDDSVSRLHARIRRQDYEYWLFDEGGSEGTYLNYDRLGLAPQKLNDGDIVQFGKAAYRFRLRQIVDLD